MVFRFVEKTKIPQLPERSEGWRRTNVLRLPKSSGVYVFKKDREFLYIGKASNLKERVKNHFSQPAYRDGLFINQVSKVGFLKTDSEIEALILEANLIKKYQPKYNVIWRDDKNYFYVGITKEDFPRIFITHRASVYGSEGQEEDKVLFAHQPKSKSKKIPSSPPSFSLRENSVINYLGPFVDGKSLKAVLKSLRKVFPFRSCKTLPKHPCLWYQLGRCPAPCFIKPEIPGFKEKIKSEGQRNAKNLMGILQGKKNQVLKNLKKEMKKASNLENYEKATKIRDQIRALEKVLAHAKIFELEAPQKVDWPQIQKILQKVLNPPAGGKKGISRIEAYDVSNIQGQEATGSMVTFVRGLPDKNFYRKFKIKIAGKPNDIAMIKEVLSRRLRHPEWPYPDLILIDGGISQLNAARKSKIQNPKSKKIPVIALAKKENKLYIENRKKPILLKSLPREIFNLILQLRDEAHRFAISYHKKLRDMTLLEN